MVLSMQKIERDVVLQSLWSMHQFVLFLPISFLITVIGWHKEWSLMRICVEPLQNRYGQIFTGLLCSQTILCPNMILIAKKIDSKFECKPLCSWWDCKTTLWTKNCLMCMIPCTTGHQSQGSGVEHAGNNWTFCNFLRLRRFTSLGFFVSD